jgi:hypothetical protein
VCLSIWMYTMSIKSITVANSMPEDYKPHEIKDAASARAASIHLLFSHVADFHKIIVKIIAEKYKIKEEDIYNTIVNHPDYTGMTINPFIYGLSYINQEDANKALAEMEEVEVVKNEVIEPAVAVKVKAVRKKKLEVVPVEAPIEAPVQEHVQQKIKIVRKKKVAE